MAVERAEIVDKLKSIFQRVKEDEIDLAQVTEDATVMEDLGLDSLDLMEVRFDLESAWKINISDEDASKLRTVRDVVDLVEQRVAS